MEYWDSLYRAQNSQPLEACDDWLKRHAHLLPPRGHVLDLGCGSGVHTRELLGMGMHVTASDFSPAALDIVRRHSPAAQTVCFDMTQPFPFEDNCFDAIVADLSLHYFSWRDTQRIIDEIERTLRPGGVLLARVHDIRNIDPSGLEELERHYYISGGYPRRYFSADDLSALFGHFKALRIQEDTISRYGMIKHVFDLAFCADES